MPGQSRCRSGWWRSARLAENGPILLETGAKRFQRGWFCLEYGFRAPFLPFILVQAAIFASRTRSIFPFVSAAFCPVVFGDVLSCLFSSMIQI